MLLSLTPNVYYHPVNERSILEGRKSGYFSIRKCDEKLLSVLSEAARPADLDLLLNREYRVLMARLYGSQHLNTLNGSIYRAIWVFYCEPRNQRTREVYTGALEIKKKPQKSTRIGTPRVYAGVCVLRLVPAHFLFFNLPRTHVPVIPHCGDCRIDDGHRTKSYSA